MAKKKRRSKKGGSFNAFAFLLVLAAAAAVIWAILPVRQHHRVRNVAHVAVITPVPAAATAEPTETPAPAATATPAELPSPTPTPAALHPSGRGHGEGGPQLAIIIDDCGQWLDTERGVIALPIPITLAVLPHVHYSTLIAREASDAGKGVMLHLPMEPVSHANPGPGEIKAAMSDDQIVAQTEDDVAQVPLAKGLNNHEGSAASADQRVMNDVMGVVKNHGLFFVDSMTSSKSVGSTTAQADGVPNASRDVFLDNEADVAYSEAQLRRAMELARKNGSAIAIGHPKPTTLAAIKALYPEIQSSGIEFVLASELVH